MRKALLALFLALAASIPSFAADPALAGTWKLDPAKSHFVGDTFTLSRLPDGKMHYSDGGPFQYDFAPDGREYPASFGYSVTVTGQDPDHWTLVNKREGKILSTDLYTLSDGGKTLAIHSTGTRPDSSTIDDQTVYTRVSGAAGPEGKWRSVKNRTSSPGLAVISFPSASTIKWVIPDYKETIEGRLDGSDLPVTGSEAMNGMMLAVKKVSDYKLTYLIKADGKVIGQGVFTAAPDGKSATDVSWAMGKESEKMTGFYTKQ